MNLHKTKTTLQSILFMMLIFICSCNRPNSGSESTIISTTEKESIEKAISAQINEVIKGSKALDVDAASKPYADNAKFRIVNPDGSVTDFQTMKNAQSEAFKTLASMNFITVKKEFTFLSKDIVICTWTGTNEFELKSGEKMKIDPYIGTLIFKKTNNEWKIIYAHETTAAPILVNN